MPGNYTGTLTLEESLVAELTAMRPRPRRIVARKPGGREVDVTLKAGMGRWQQAAKAIRSLLEGGTAVEAHAEDGSLIREWSPDLVADAPAAEPQRAPEPARVVTLDDIEERRLLLMAKLEDAALERSMKLIKPLMDVYAKNIETLCARVDTLTHAYSKAVDSLVKVQVAKGEAEVALLASEAEALQEQRPRPADQLADVLIRRFGGGPPSTSTSDEGDPH